MKTFKYVMIAILIFFISAVYLELKAQTGVIENGNEIYLSNTIVLKLKDGVRTTTNGKTALPINVENYLNKIGIVNIKQRFNPKNNRSKSGILIERILSIEYSSPHDPKFISQKISKLKEIDWAEPHYLYRPVFNPNDPQYTTQYNLSKINASSAWDINQGNPNIIVAIDDTGVDWDHPDLADNIWQNDDPINGIDDDGNGYIDDVRGWDFGGLDGTPDNNPMEDRPDHGTHVAGIASAVTNNGIGIASIGFNCTIMPVKTSRDDIRTTSGQALISYGYEGMVYAVDNGAKVINCSWGSSAFSIAAQEVINYAVENGTLVVGAAGNDGGTEVIYPGKYNGALSVGSTNQNDQKSSFSNYGIDVEVMAPGSNIYSTWQNDTYTALSGTSMASPLTAGLASLVFAQFPTYTPLQIKEQIRVNCDNIDYLNSGYEYLLGGGRINAYNALSNTLSISVRAADVEFIDEGDGDGVFEEGEDVSVNVGFINYLNPTSELTITLEDHSGYVAINNSSYSAGAVPTLGVFNNSASKFTLTINSSIPDNAQIKLLLKYNDGGYDDFQWISFIANPTYRTQSGNNIALTITSKGALAFNDYPNNLQGEGFIFDDGSNLTFEGGLMYGTGENHLVDEVRGANQNIQSTDFFVVQPFLLSIPGTISDQQGHAVFNDDGAGASKLNIETELNSHSFADSPNDNYIILEYVMSNKSGNQIDNLFTGLYFDWDIDDSDYNDNISAYDSDNNFGYAYNQDGNPITTHIGVALISSDDYGYYAIDNDGGNGSINIYDGFSDTEKWTMISNGVSRQNAGASDISMVTSGGPFTIPAGGSIKAAFAIGAAGDLTNLRTTIQQSRVKYNSITAIDYDPVIVPEKFTLFQNYPNPFNPATKIKFSIPTKGFVQLKIYDILGRERATLLNEEKSAGIHEIEFDSEAAGELPSGVYFYRLSASGKTDIKKMILIK